MYFNQFKNRYERKLWEQKQLNGIDVVVSEEELYKLFLAHMVVREYEIKKEKTRARKG